MKKKRLAALACNLAIIAAEIFSMWTDRDVGTRNFVYYTQDSNYVLLISCLAYAAAAFIKRGRETPLWVKVLRYVATCLTAETFFVVLFILTPAMGGLKNSMLYGSMLYLHCLCPLIAMASLLLFEDTRGLAKKHLFWAILPTLLYEVISASLNILRIWNGPYPFLKVYEQPVWMSCFWAVAVPGLGFLCAWLFLRLLLRKNRTR